MQKLIIETKTADFKAGKYVDETITAVVASTKSQNNLLEEIAKQGKVVTNVTVKELFADKKATSDAINSLVEGLFGNEDKETRNAIALHIMDSLNRHCVFYNPIVRRK